MPSLKEFRNRIKSVKSTRKITSAMKMVAGAKLRRATDQAQSGRPYAAAMESMLLNLARNVMGSPEAPRLMQGTGKDQVHLLVVATSDRGLCGAFNSSIVRRVRAEILRLKKEGKEIKILCVGRKGRDLLRRDFAPLILETVEDIGKPRLNFSHADLIAEKILKLFDDGACDVVNIFYNRFKSAISQIVTSQQLIPVPVPEASNQNDSVAAKSGPKAIYEFEPSAEEILAELLPRNLRVQIYRALLENAASEQGARMVAMDNATRNAGDMINKLNLNYNRARQAYITKEMIEIVSGAEAV